MIAIPPGLFKNSFEVCAMSTRATPVGDSSVPGKPRGADSSVPPGESSILNCAFPDGGTLTT